LNALGGEGSQRQFNYAFKEAALGAFERGLVSDADAATSQGLDPAGQHVSSDPSTLDLETAAEKGCG
jgi:hypothetical protein